MTTPKPQVYAQSAHLLPNKDGIGLHHAAEDWTSPRSKVDAASLPSALYHVTTDLPAILRDGVLRAGKGGSGKRDGIADPSHPKGEPPGVSLTTNPVIAQRLYRDLQRAAAMARGEHKPAILRHWANEDERAANLPAGRLRSVAHTAARMMLDNPHNPESALDALMHYNEQRELAGGYRDPILRGDFESYKKLSPEQIGILAVHSKQIPAGAGMREGDDGPSEVRVYADVPLGEQMTNHAVIHPERIAHLMTKALPEGEEMTPQPCKKHAWGDLFQVPDARNSDPFRKQHEFTLQNYSGDGQYKVCANCGTVGSRYINPKGIEKVRQVLSGADHLTRRAQAWNAQVEADRAAGDWAAQRKRSQYEGWLETPQPPIEKAISSFVPKRATVEYDPAEGIDDSERHFWYRSGDVASRSEMPARLYHVTTNLPAVLSSGYLRPSNRADAGGLGAASVQEPHVSFTRSRADAANIRRELTRVGEIARNGLTPAQLRAHAREDEARSNVPVGHFEAAVENALDFGKSAGGHYGSPQDDALQTYNWYLGERQGLGGDKNPVMAGDAKSYAKVRPETIGILAVHPDDINNDHYESGAVRHYHNDPNSEIRLYNAHLPLTQRTKVITSTPDQPQPRSTTKAVRVIIKAAEAEQSNLKQRFLNQKPELPQAAPPEYNSLFRSVPHQLTHDEFASHPDVYWHGTPWGEMGGGENPLVHVGTWKAAHDALGARIAGGHTEGDIPDTTFGKTRPIYRNRKTGKEVAFDHPRHADGSYDQSFNGIWDFTGKTTNEPQEGDIPAGLRPAMLPVKIVGPMARGLYRDATDADGRGTPAESILKRQIKQGVKPKQGYYYKNTGEGVEVGPDGKITYSKSAVVPNRSWLKTHEDFVREALQRGEEVPGRVLADYPHLQNPMGKAITAAAERNPTVAIRVRPDQIRKINDWGQAKYQYPNGYMTRGNPITKQELPPLLYHATPNLPPIDRSGALLSMTGTNHGGLGGTNQPAVSFTRDKRLATNIYRELLRAGQLARGEASVETHLPQWAAEDERYAGLPQGALKTAADKGINYLNFNIDTRKQWQSKPEYAEWKEKYGDAEGTDDEFRRTTGWDAYKSYLNAREYAGGSPNPLMIGGLDNYARVRPETTGIVAVPSRNIPDDAFMEHIPNDNDEVKIHADVPLHGAKYVHRQPLVLDKSVGVLIGHRRRIGVLIKAARKPAVDKEAAYLASRSHVVPEGVDVKKASASREAFTNKALEAARKDSLLGSLKTAQGDAVAPPIPGGFTSNEDLGRLAEMGAHGRHWYQEWQDALMRHGENPTEGKRFALMFGATGDGTPVEQNYPFALSAYSQWKNGLLATDPAVHKSLESEYRLLRGFGQSGSNHNNLALAANLEAPDSIKIADYGRALNGDHEAMPIDVWMARMMTGKDGNPKAEKKLNLNDEYHQLQGRVRDALHAYNKGRPDDPITPREWQAMLWVGYKKLVGDHLHAVASRVEGLASGKDQTKYQKMANELRTQGRKLASDGRAATITRQFGMVNDEDGSIRPLPSFRQHQILSQIVSPMQDLVDSGAVSTRYVGRNPIEHGADIAQALLRENAHEPEAKRLTYIGTGKKPVIDGDWRDLRALWLKGKVNNQPTDPIGLKIINSRDKDKLPSDHTYQLVVKENSNKPFPEVHKPDLIERTLQYHPEFLKSLQHLKAIEEAAGAKANDEDSLGGYACNFGHNLGAVVDKAHDFLSANRIKSEDNFMPDGTPLVKAIEGESDGFNDARTRRTQSGSSLPQRRFDRRRGFEYDPHAGEQVQGQPALHQRSGEHLHCSLRKSRPERTLRSRQPRQPRQLGGRGIGAGDKRPGCDTRHVRVIIKATGAEQSPVERAFRKELGTTDIHTLRNTSHYIYPNGDISGALEDYHPQPPPRAMQGDEEGDWQPAPYHENVSASIYDRYGLNNEGMFPITHTMKSGLMTLRGGGKAPSLGIGSPPTPRQMSTLGHISRLSPEEPFYYAIHDPQGNQVSSGDDFSQLRRDPWVQDASRWDNTSKAVAMGAVRPDGTRSYRAYGEGAESQRLRPVPKRIQPYAQMAQRVGLQPFGFSETAAITPHPDMAAMGQEATPYTLTHRYYGDASAARKLAADLARRGAVSTMTPTSYGHALTFEPGDSTRHEVQIHTQRPVMRGGAETVAGPYPIHNPRVARAAAMSAPAAPKPAQQPVAVTPEPPAQPAASAMPTNGAKPTQNGARSHVINDAMAALLSLGYKRKTASEALKSYLAINQNTTDLDALIRGVLGHLAPKGLSLQQEEIMNKAMQEKKGSKEEAKYRTAEPGSKKRCAGCEHYKDGACAIVAGTIKPNYVCDWYEKC